MSEPKVRQAKTSDLTPDIKNANKGTERGLRALDHSLRQYGAGRSILLDKTGRIIAGNKTHQTAADIGLEDVIIVQTDGTKLVAVQRTDLDLDEPRARAMAVSDNRVGELDLSWDIDELLASVAEGVDLSALFREDELDALLQAAHGQDEATGEDKGAQVDRAAELKEQYGTKLGQVWQLGAHRLAVGDCTDRATVEAVMRGEKASMMFTDPPYGVDYDGGHFHSGDVNIKRAREKLASDEDSEIYTRFLPVVMPFIDGPCYMFFSDSRARDVYNAVHDCKGEVHALIIWHKVNATYAAMNAQYKKKHEPCLYFKPKGSTLRWTGPTDECTVWDIPREGRNELHPTQKPVALAERAINNHSAQIVADWFLGSGTTLVACEKLNRKCRAIELDEGYAAVSIHRYFEMTGKEPRLIT